jgi:DNA modification methylase
MSRISDPLQQLSENAGDELQVHYVSLASLADKFLSGNSKKHDMGTLSESVNRYSFRDPIAFDSALNGGTGGIVEGNGRLNYLIQAKEQGQAAPRGIKAVEDDWYVPVVFGVNAASEAEGIAYSISHNLSPLWGSDLDFIDQTRLFDEDLLRDQLTGLADLDLLPIGIDGDDLDFWLGSIEEEPELEAEDQEALENLLDKVDEIKSRVKLGEIWACGRHRVACGDSTDEGNIKKLLGNCRFEMIFIDPPYGVNNEGGHFHSGDVNTVNKREKLKNDDSEEIYTKVVPLLAKYCDGPIYTWFAGTKPLSLYQSVAKVGEIHALIIWHKTNATYAAMNAQYKQRHEPCLYWKAKGKTLRWIGATTEATLWEIKKDGVNNFHPTQKPIELAQKAIGNHNAKLIGDFFLGSGSTMIAAQQMKGDRTVYGFELSESYCEVILQRYEALTGETAKLVGHL